MKYFFKNQYGNLRWGKIFGMLGLFIILMIALFIGKIYLDIHSAMGNITHHVDVQQMREEKLDIKAGEPMNVLLIGTDDNKLDRDEDDGYVSRSDTLIVISLNPEKENTKILSIPRDTYTEIEGRPTAEKINHAYAYGGVELTIDTVQKYLHIPIDYYAVVNMSGLQDLIDSIGGIEVTSPLTFNYRGTQFYEGETRHVNGVKAMNFARMRYDDPEGEVGRQNRQKIVIKAIIDKFLSENLINNYQEFLNVIQQNIQTNINLRDILGLYKTYVPALKSLTSIHFDKMDEIYIDNIFYFDIPIESRLKVANEIRRQTDLKSISATDLGEGFRFESRANKSLQIVFNQYPSGVSEKEKQSILDSQNQVRNYRETEYYAPVQTTLYDNYYPVQQVESHSYNNQSNENSTRIEYTEDDRVPPSSSSSSTTSNIGIDTLPSTGYSQSSMDNVLSNTNDVDVND